MNILVSYADSKYEGVRKWNTITGKLFGHFDKVYEFKPEDIEPSFKESHADIFSYSRGGGLWLWKPYFINKVIKLSNEGDVIFYVDSASFFIRDPRVLINYIDQKQPIFACDQPLLESCWTKPELFEAMDALEYRMENQFLGGFQIFLVNEFTRKFYREWLELCCNHDNIAPSGLGKHDLIDRDYGASFVSHREDQSIFSLLCHKHGIKAHRDISQRGVNPKSFYNPHYAYRVQNHPDDKYKTILFLHKSQNLGIKFWLRYLKDRIRQFFI